MIDTGGRSIVNGARNLVDDLIDNGGMPRMVDSTPFTVGVNLACSPGAVVYREEMFELLQYRPTTATIHERPLLIVPPQINRYYILDLAPGQCGDIERFHPLLRVRRSCDKRQGHPRNAPTHWPLRVRSSK